METPCDRSLAYALENFGGARLGDRRRTQRLVRCAARIVQRPGGTLPDKFKDPAELKGLYRLMDGDSVTHAAVLEPHRRRTLERMRACVGDVLIVHDTTELDYTGKASLQHLGQIGNGSHRGYLCHNSLAIAVAGREAPGPVIAAGAREVLGLASQILHCRPEAPEGESRAARRDKPERESRLWQRGSEAIGPSPAGRRWIDVCDRGGDLFEYLDYKHVSGGHYVVRSKHDRQLEPSSPDSASNPGAAKPPAAAPMLHAFARALPELGRKTISIPVRDKRPARQATVRVGAGRVRLSPPRQARGEHGDAALTAWVVYIGEIGAGEIGGPSESDAVEWILLTNIPTAGFAEACERSDWYSCRWIVEEYHKAQKTGCGIEAPQFTSEERLEPMIGLLSVVAVSLLELRCASRRADAAQRPVREIVAPEYVEVLSAWRHKIIRPNWSVLEFFMALARLGGHQNRKRDHPPGWLVLWRGWSTLENMVLGVRAMETVRCGQT